MVCRRCRIHLGARERLRKPTPRFDVPSLAPPEMVKRFTATEAPDAKQSVSVLTVSSEEYNGDREEGGSDRRKDKKVDSAKSSKARGRSRTRCSTIKSPQQIQDLRESFTKTPRINTANNYRDVRQPKKMNEKDREYFGAAREWGHHDHELGVRIDWMLTMPDVVDDFEKGALGIYEDGASY